MKKINAQDVIYYSYDVIAMWGDDSATGLVCNQIKFITGLADRFGITNKQAQSLYKGMLKFGYMKATKVSEGCVLCALTQKADDLITKYHG